MIVPDNMYFTLSLFEVPRAAMSHQELRQRSVQEVRQMIHESQLLSRSTKGGTQRK